MVLHVLFGHVTDMVHRKRDEDVVHDPKEREGRVDVLDERPRLTILHSQKVGEHRIYK